MFFSQVFCSLILTLNSSSRNSRLCSKICIPNTLVLQCRTMASLCPRRVLKCNLPGNRICTETNIKASLRHKCNSILADLAMPDHQSLILMVNFRILQILLIREASILFREASTEAYSTQRHSPSSLVMVGDLVLSKCYLSSKCINSRCTSNRCINSLSLSMDHLA